MPFYIFLTAIFLVFGFKFLAGPWVYAIDWAERVLIIVIVLVYAARCREIIWTRPVWPSAKENIAFLLATVVLSIGIYASSSYVDELWPEGRWHSFPAYMNDLMEYVDLTLGIALVAVSEELVFRWYPALMARRKDWSETYLQVVGVIGFMAIHIPQGATNTLFSGLFGFFLMLLYRRYQSLWIPIALHFIYDSLAFAGVFKDLLGWMGYAT